MPPLAALKDLRSRLGGPLLKPGDPAYDTLRRVWNGMIDRRPAMIAQCRDAADVASCIRVARDHQLPLTVRGGGHNYAGKAVCDDGLMIDLTLMKDIQINEAARTAQAQTGLKLGEFDRATQNYGLATPMGVATTTGISGLTLGGGYGWLAGKYGLACDNVLAIEVVTAAGEILECDAEHNAELFWGLRGAGANFGIATRIDYRLHPVSTIYGGVLLQPLRPEVMRFYDEFSKSCPDEMTTLGVALWGPDGKPAFATALCYHGPAEEGARLVEPLRNLTPPLVDLIQPRPYLEMQSLFDADFKPGRRYYNKAHNLSAFNDDAIATTTRYAHTMPAHPSSIGFQQLHGAAARVPAGDTAFPHRHPHYVIWISPVADDPVNDDAMIRWARECWQAFAPDVERAVYVNALDDGAEEGDARVRDAYGVNYDRLRRLKQQVDPHNLFQQNSNIVP